jgi:DNA-binding response OmpR family regulator
VLIVDDDSAAADALAAAFTVDGFRTSAAEIGYAALRTPPGMGYGKLAS